MLRCASLASAPREAAVPLVVVDDAVGAEVVGGSLAKTGHQVPAGTAAAQVIERE
jgi:hypothetical protein